MHVGHNCYIDDKWIPKDKPTGFKDINGVEIRTSMTVKLRGCGSNTAIVGVWDGKFRLYFGSENGSVGWYLDEATIQGHHIEVVQK
jgi:hypothetical protein